MDNNLIIVAFYSYFLGSIPFGLILTKLFLQKDIRELGSGNIGTTNVLRTGNKFLAASTLIFDLLKGYLSIYITLSFFESLVSYSGLICFIGHIFPVWLKFKGGKGVATYVGILFSINFILGFIFGIVWIVTYLLSKFSSLASILASVSIPIFVFLSETNNAIFYLIMFVLVFYTHRENIKRLINKQETKTKIY